MTAGQRPAPEVRDAVMETLLDYCQFVDEKRIDDFANLFIEDCHFDEGRVYRGRAEVHRIVGKLVSGFARMSHHLSNVRIYSTGPGTAEALSYIYAWHQQHDGHQFEIWGRYQDVLRDDGDRWRFCRREVQMQGFKGLDSLAITPVPLHGEAAGKE